MFNRLHKLAQIDYSAKESVLICVICVLFLIFNLAYMSHNPNNFCFSVIDVG